MIAFSDEFQYMFVEVLSFKKVHSFLKIDKLQIAMYWLLQLLNCIMVANGYSIMFFAIQVHVLHIL